MQYKIIEYTEKYHDEWVKCRLLSFLDSSYFDDVHREKEKEENPTLSLLALFNDEVIGFIDIEYESNIGDVYYLKGKQGGVVWHLGVLKQYRRHGVANRLLEDAIVRLKDLNIERLEAWTQDDLAANKWYEKQGFVFKESYLNAYFNGSLDNIKEYLNLDKIGTIYGIRKINFEAPIERKDELSKICYRLHEVKLYELRF